MSTEKVLFYGGLALAALALVLFAVRAVLLRKKQRALAAALDSEYGAPKERADVGVNKCQK